MRSRGRSISEVPQGIRDIAHDGYALVLASQRKEENVRFLLMISLVMRMHHILVECMLEGRFTKQNKPPRHSSLTGRTHRSAYALRVATVVAVGPASPQLHQ